MAEDRLNIQVKKSLVLQLKDLSVKLTAEKGKMIPMQKLADIAISEYINKTRKVTRAG